MRKLPVFATVGNAVGFAFADFFTVLRLTWLPFVAYGVALAGAVYHAQGTILLELLESDPPDLRILLRHLDDVAFLYVAMIVLQVIVLAAVAVSIHKVILFGDRKPGEYFVFAFGRTEFLYVVMVVLSVIGVLAILAAVMAPFVYAVSGGDFAAFFAGFDDMKEAMRDLVQSGRIGVVLGGYLLGWLLLLYFGLRLAVWPAAVVATGRLALGETWALTRGNVLRILGMFVLMIVVIVIVAIPIGLVFAAIMVPFAIQYGRDLENASGPEAMHEMIREMALPYILVFGVVELLVYAFFTGLTVATLSYAYKALKGVDAKAPLSPEG